MDSNGNTGNLEGLQCPECGHSASLRVNGQASFTLRDKYATDYGNPDWGEDDWAECPECLFEDTVETFMIEKQEA